ncbi:MAG TPA: GntR family transcriptional regulator [Gammaproteobacteria bacterium]|nr:GntR family transcriptional regulator [Gammaproteobacteria bacterium]
MVKIGKINRLQVVKSVDFGIYLDGEEAGEILLPSRYLPAGCAPGEWLEVFIYRDSEDRLIATTETPFAMVDQCAYLKVVAINRIGAFLDWGLPKDLLVPFSEQRKPMQVGHSYVVFLYLDGETDRVAASTRLHDHLSEKSFYFKPQQAVDLLISNRTDMGYQAVVDGTHLGLIYSNEIFQPLRVGQKVHGYIKQIRPDLKIDLCLQLDNQQTRDALETRILDYLKKHDSVSTLTDKSPPEAIYKAFGVSKKKYKKALGGLYKSKLILIEKQKITLLSRPEERSSPWAQER